MKKLLVSAVAGAALLGASVAFAFSPNDYTLFGEANYISPGNNASTRAVQLNSIGATYGGIDYGVGATTLTLSTITTLSTDYRFSAGSCAGGSPRFQINLGDPVTGAYVGNIFVYLGSAPSYTNCAQYVWANSGNLVTPASLVDTSQLPGGTFYDPYASALIKYGNYKILGVQIAVDGGWMLPETGQVVDIDNTMISSTLYTYENPTPTGKEQCKDDNWMDYTRANGSHFKNQGDCIQYVNTGK